MTFKYRWSLITSFICSALVAVLWSLNLGAVYPFVEIILHGHSLHDWVEIQQTEANSQLRSLQSQIAELERQLATAGGSESQELRRQIFVLTDDIEIQQSSLAVRDQLAVHIRRWAPEKPFDTLVALMLLMFVGTVLRGIFLMGSMVTVARVGQRTMLDLQNDVFRNVLDMEPSELAVKGTGDLVSRIRGETSSIGQAIMVLFGKTIREPLKMVGCLTGAAIVNWRLLLLSLLICPLAAYLMLRLAKVTKRANKRAMEDSAKLLNRLYQSLTFMRVVRAFNMEDGERRRFQIVAKDVYKKSMRISWFSSLARINTELFGIVMISLSVLAGGYLVLNHETHLFGIRMCAAPMNFGSVMMFFGFLIGIADPLRKMGDVFNLIQSGMVAADRVFPLIDQLPAVTDPVDPLPLPAGPLAVEFKNVRFEYESGRSILKGVSAKIPAGSSLAILGHNGCGKSTLINLIPRFFDVCSSEPNQSSGAIKIGELDVRQVRVKDLRKRIGYVTQTTMLFSDTIAENIAYGMPWATREQIIEAAKKAHAHEFILALEEGYDTNIGDRDGILSGGQRQRISLARAILKDPEILILDESTSQIDPESKELIHHTLADFMRNRTTILITHQMSTLNLVDRIMLMRDGQVVDCGTHEQMLGRCDEYRRMQNLRLEDVA